MEDTETQWQERNQGESRSPQTPNSVHQLFTKATLKTESAGSTTSRMYTASWRRRARREGVTASSPWWTGQG